MGARTIKLRVRSLRIEIEAASDFVGEAFEQDFSHFIENFDGFPDFRLSVIARDHYFKGGIKLGDYRWKRLSDGTILASFFEKACVTYRHPVGEAEVYCENSELAYEVAYSTLLSFVGERLDQMGLHRLHGLGLSLKGKGVVLLGSSGKGKSTLAFSLVKHGQSSSLLSDDLPFVCWTGKMFAFPQRIALREKPAIEETHLRSFRREKFGEKFLVGSEFYRNRILQEADLSWLVLLERTDEDRTRFERVSRLRLIVPLLRWLVLGHETPQILPLFFRLSVEDFFAKIRIAGLRTFCAFRLFMKARAGKLFLSRYPVECARYLEGIDFDVTDPHRDSRPLAGLPEMLGKRTDSPA